CELLQNACGMRESEIRMTKSEISPNDELLRADRTRRLAASSSRRSFIKNSLLASSAAIFLPSHVLGRSGNKSPNSKLNLAGIGIGGQGAQDLQQLSSENIVALCDVDAVHAGRIFKKYSKAKVYTDFRKM